MESNASSNPFEYYNSVIRTIIGLDNKIFVPQPVFLAKYGGLEVAKITTETAPSETTLAILLKVLILPKTLST
jgi:hypothetical protein